MWMMIKSRQQAAVVGRCIARDDFRVVSLKASRPLKNKKTCLEKRKANHITQNETVHVSVHAWIDKYL